MYQIGIFSRMCQVAVSALRYYDELGLLTPAWVDPETGYRYYSAAQLPRLNRILSLKDLGLSLAEITRVLSDDLSAEELRGMLRRERATIQETMRTEEARLLRVENRIRLIEKEGTMPTSDVVIRNLEPTPVLSIRDVVSIQEIGALIADAYAGIVHAGVTPHEPGFALYHDPEFNPTEVDVEMAFPLSEIPEQRPQTPAGRVFEARTIPGGRAAVITHTGPYDTISTAYTTLGTWIAENNLTIAGPTQEAYLTAPDDPNGPVTEIRFPVQN